MNGLVLLRFPKGSKKADKKNQKAPKQHKNVWFGAFGASKRTRNGVEKHQNRIKMYGFCAFWDVAFWGQKGVQMDPKWSPGVKMD